MKKGLTLFIFLALQLTTLTTISAQSAGGSSNGFIIGLIVLGVLLLFWAILTITDNLLQIEAGKAGIDIDKEDMGLFPSLKNMFSKKAPAFAQNDHFVNLKKGFDLKLEGEAESVEGLSENVTRYAVSPYDFRGISPIPKVTVEIGDEVQAGDVIFFDKKNPDVKYTAPVSGEIVDIQRGAKRSISNVIILADKEQKHKQFEVPSLESSREELVNFLQASGAWSLFNQRPFDIIPSTTEVPRDIFVSTFDTAPLAPKTDVMMDGNAEAFQHGINLLAKLTSGNVHVGLDGKSTPGSAFANLQNAKKHFFSGPHPAGNVGIQIHHIDPIRVANDIVWTVDLQDVIILGRLFKDGVYNTQKVVAITGAELNEPKYVKVYTGANIGELLKGNLSNEDARLISGDVYSGDQKTADDFLCFRDNQITVVEEGNKYELFGWLLPISPRPSISNTFPNFLFPKHKFKAETNTHGEKRAFVVTGQYEKVLPMDIYPQALMKSIVTQDMERMEGLGIAELSEEDIALCEFVCTSKTPMQQILREGLDMVREQL